MQDQKAFGRLTINLRGVLVVASVIVYLLLLIILYPITGTSASAFVILPVMMTGWCFGLRVGFLAGLSFIVFNWVLLNLLTNRSLTEGLLQRAPSYLAVMLAGMVVGYLHDLRQRQNAVERALCESETRFRTLVEQSPFSTQIFRPDGSVITVNQAFCSLWNASPIEAQYVIEHYNILQDEQLEANGLIPFVKQGFTTGFAEIPAIEYIPQKTETVKHTHLATKWVTGYIWPVKDERGQVQQVVLMHQDITQHKWAEAQQIELALTQERAELLKELLNTLSHDLKTPLSIMNTSLHLLQRSSDPAYQQSKIDTLQQQAHSLHQMLQNILTASYLETASKVLTHRVDINAMIRQIEEEFYSVAEGRSITLQIKLDHTLPPVVGNEVELRRVFVNLVENALSYTLPTGRVTLQMLRESNQVVVEVCDTGIGIEEQDIAHIFEAFYRADKARSTDYGGTGLGLAIAKKIIERHQGTIDVESKLGQGSIFRVRLPILQEYVVE